MIRVSDNVTTASIPYNQPNLKQVHHQSRQHVRDIEEDGAAEIVNSQINSTSLGQTTNLKEALRQQRRAQVIGRISSTVGHQRSEALGHFQLGQQEYANGNVMQAATAMHLACELDPDNEAFKQHYEMVRKEARVLKAQEFIDAAENAESFSNWGRAIEQYRKAVSYECEAAAPYARLSCIENRSRSEGDPTFASTVLKDPENPDYHCMLGEAYFRQDMTLNAKG